MRMFRKPLSSCSEAVFNMQSSMQVCNWDAFVCFGFMKPDCGPYGFRLVLLYSNENVSYLLNVGEFVAKKY